MEVINPALQKSMQALQPDERLPVFVFFTDKGIADNAEYNQALAQAESRLTEAARYRRLKARGADNLVDFRDLPVSESYASYVLSTGASLRTTLRWFNAISVNATPAQIAAIASISQVRYLKEVAHSTVDHNLPLDPISSDMQLVTLDYGPSEGQLNQVNVIPAHELGFKGQNVIVSMFDTGFRQQHDAFQNIINSGRLIAQYDFINDDDDTDYDPDQESEGQPSHGTVTWSTLGGEASGHLYGPSYMASFVLCKTEDISSERHIEEDNWAAAALWVDSIGASVISSSLGYKGFDPPETSYTYDDLDGNTTIATQAADLAVYNGIAVATAMGNDGPGDGSLIAPADGDSVIACGAVGPNGTLAWFSAWGPTSDGRIKPEVCAQGEQTVCVNPYSTTEYSTSSGTSLSTPIVGGACGVLLSAHPNWTPVMVREALMMTGSRADSANNEYGHGIIDVIRALYYHPEGDFIFNFRPRLITAVNQPIDFNVNITGGAGIASAQLYWRNGSSGNFTAVGMSQDGQDYSAQIPGQVGQQVQYYFKATDAQGVFAYHPVGDSAHPFSIGLGGTQFIDSLDHGLLYWESGGVYDFWGFSAKYSRSGNLSITESTYGNYRNNTDSYLTSRFALDLSTATSSNFSFWWRGLMQSAHDTLFVEVSSQGGAWQRRPEFISASGFSFAQYSTDLSPYFGNPDVRLRFHFMSDATGRNEGLYIDDIAINLITTGIDDENVPLPQSVRLEQNYPNPFNPATKISFFVPVDGPVKLSVFDLLGRKVKTLISGDIAGGSHEVVWDGRDQGDNEASSGVYIYRLQAGDSDQSRRMTLVR
jgi:hypothetical protein